MINNNNADTLGINNDNSNDDDDDDVDDVDDDVDDADNVDDVDARATMMLIYPRDPL